MSDSDTSSTVSKSQSSSSDERNRRRRRRKLLPSSPNERNRRQTKRKSLSSSLDERNRRRRRRVNAESKAHVTSCVNTNSVRHIKQVTDHYYALLQATEKRHQEELNQLKASIKNAAPEKNNSVENPVSENNLDEILLDHEDYGELGRGLESPEPPKPRRFEKFQKDGAANSDDDSSGTHQSRLRVTTSAVVHHNPNRSRSPIKKVLSSTVQRVVHKGNTPLCSYQTDRREDAEISRQTPLSQTMRADGREAVNVRDVHRARSIRFFNLDEKLNTGSHYVHWSRQVKDAIRSQECSFLIDEKVPPPADYSELDISLAKDKVRFFILSNVSPYYHNLVWRQEPVEPHQLLEDLRKICEPTTKHHFYNLTDAIATIKFDPRTEKVVEFISRFEDLVRKIREIHPAMMTDVYVKVAFLRAIVDSDTWQKEHNSPHPEGYTFDKLKSLLIDEEDMWNQMSKTGSSSNTTALFSGSKGSNNSWKRGKGRRGYGWRQASRSENQPHQPTTSQDDSELKSKRNINMRCSSCHVRGHASRECRKMLRECYFCHRMTRHVSKTCPQRLAAEGKQKKKKGPRSDKTKASTKGDDKQSTSQPKMVRMPFKKALSYKKHFSGQRDSVFTIANEEHASPDDEVWVLMNSDDENELAQVSYMEEQQSGAAYSSAEGEWN